MKFKITLVFLLFIFSLSSYAQNVKVYGTVSNVLNNEPIPFSNISIVGTNIGAISDIDGNFELLNVEPGTYNFRCSYIGFEPSFKSEIRVSSNKNLRLNFVLSENAELIEEVQITANTFNKTEESPTSLRTINASEIYRSPGGDRDISKVIANLPGVSTAPSFRNDIIIRGGAPSENRFYLDGVEIPNINHFATQGSSGGPVGIINVNLIREVDFYSGAFPANRGNVLSSVMELKQIEGSDENLSGTFSVGSSDAGLSISTPIGQKSTMLLSVRRSYLQFLFQALQLPFLPTYNDLQFKFTHKPNKKNQFNIIALAAVDEFSLNTSVNDNIEDSLTLARNNYILDNLPVNEQWNYTIGGTWKHFFEQSNLFLVASRSHLNNSANKYFKNIEIEENKILDYQSEEIENKTRLEYNFRKESIKYNVGVGLDHVTYKNQTYNRLPFFTKNVSSDFSFLKYSAFAQLSKTYLNNKLISSFGARVDNNSFTESKSAPNFSPRASLSYKLSEKSSLNANLGRFFQLPSYTILGYTDSLGQYLNKDVDYIRCDHAVFGYEFNPNNYSKITVEGFYKQYNNYPFSIRDSVSLANLGGDFGVIGNEDVSSSSEGKSYGIELLAQQKLSESIYGILSVTYYTSLFEDKNLDLIPSSWDNRYIFNLAAGKKFKRNIELGVKFRYSGGAPYTPFDLATSSMRDVWDVNQQGYLDYNNVNSVRLADIHTLDIRLDKKWFFKSWSLNAYIDIQNLYNNKIKLRSDVSNNPDVGPIIYDNDGDPDRYSLYEIPNESGTVLPSIGLLIEF
jgi:outer membrane receptor for ferrienterochelin and colicin